MKKQLQLVSIFFFVFILHTRISAQCTYFSAVSDVTLNCTAFGPDKSGVAYNPNQNLYYSVTAGSASYNLETFPSTGGNAVNLVIQGANYRGYWWNPTTNRPEGNVFNANVTSNSINGLGYPTGTSTVGLFGTPTGTAAQSAGALNLNNTNQILYYDNNTLYRYSRLGGTFISSVTITGLPAGTNVNLWHIIYTGVAGSEVGLYDYTNRRVLFIDYTTGAYTNYCQLPGTAPTPAMYNFAYANNRVFLYDQANTRWIGYPITGSSCPGESMQFNGGGYVEKSAFTLGGSWTAEAWIKPTSVSTPFWNSVVAQDYWFNYTGFAIRIVNDSVGVECSLGPASSAYIQARVTANVWTHVAATYGNGVLTFYKDGIFVGAKAMTFNNSTKPFHIGARNHNTGTGVVDIFNGTIDEVRVWNTTRSQCEIQTNMDAEIQANATGLLANYHFTQGMASGNNTGTTLLNDATTNANDATLTGVTLTGSASNFVQPGAVISNNYNANPAPTGSIVVRGNSNLIANNLAVTSTTNNTNFGTIGVATRNFVITNNGPGPMKIGKPYMTGANATEFIVTTSPATLIAAAASTTFVVTFSPTTAGAKSASININVNDCSIPVHKFLVEGASTQGAALAFAGSQTVTIPHSTAFNITAAISIEAWVKTSSAGEAYITTKSEDSWHLAVSGGGGATGKASFFLTGLSPGGWLTGTSIISDGNWHHIAGTFDGTSMRLYVDGGLEAQMQQTGTISTGISVVRIGSRSTISAFNFTGSIDEVRIWNAARSQCDIQRYMNCEIPTNFSGLVANYHFNQGTASGNNTGINTLTSSAGGNTGTLSNFSLSGSTSNWVEPGPFTSGFSTISTNSPTITVRGNSTIITDGATSASAGDFTDFGSLTTRNFVISNGTSGTLTIGTPYITGANAAEFSVTTVPSTSINPSGASTFVVTFNPAAAGTRTATINFVTNDCTKPVFDFVVSGTALAGAALKFDGSSDYIRRTETNFSTGDFCIELWVKPASFSAPNGDIYLVTNRSNDFIGSGNWYVLGIESTGQLKFNMGSANLAGGFNLFAPTSLTLNTWQHVAVTRTGTLLALYVNGVVVASGADLGARDLNAGYNIVTFGAWGAPIGQRYFNGEMDDIRLWSTNRTQCQIQATMRAEILTTAANLIGNYHFNQGVAEGNNTGLANLTDVSASAVNGVFTFFALTGATSNFVATGAVTTGSTTLATVASSILLTGGTGTVVNGATTTNTTNFTNFNGTYTRTFFIDNVGAGTLNIGTPFLTGANASEFTVTALPLGAITTGTTSFVVAFTPTALGTKTATVIFFNNDCSKPIFSFVIQATGVAGAALDLLKTSGDVISVPNVTLNNQSFTIEFWAKRNSSSDNNYIIGQGTASAYNNLHIGFRNNNRFTFSFHTSDLDVANPACTDGLYHHWACVYKSGVAGLNRLIYLDGRLIAADNAGNYTGTGAFTIGNRLAAGSPDYFNGSIDELRIWNSVRSQCDIQTYKDCEIATTAPNLTANFHFNQGVATGNNATEILLTDATGTGHTGTLTSFVLTGNASNWVATGGVNTNSFTTAAPAASLQITGNAAIIANGSTNPLVSNFTDFGSALTRTFVLDNISGGTLNIDSVYFTGAGAELFSKVTALSSLTTNTITLVIAFTPTSSGTYSANVNILTNDCNKPVFNFAITATATAAAGLNFDGSNDNVFVNNNGLMSNFGIAPCAMEAWIYPTNLGAPRSIIRKDGDYELFLNTGGFLQASIFPGGSGGGAFKLSVTTTPVVINQWSHVAAVWNGTTIALYINGLAVPTTTNSGASGTSSIMYIGYSFNFGQPFIGSIDEVRLWKTNRTHCEIQQYMNCEIGPTPGLVANFHFNDAFANVANTSTTVTDYSGNNNHGYLNFFALSGSTSNWIAPGGVTSGSVTPATLTSTLTVRGNAVNITPGSVLTNTANWTDFNGATVRTFSVLNTGTGTLNITSVTLSGDNASSFSITAQPASALLTTGANSSFNISFIPSAIGTKTAIVNVPSSDCNTPNYSFVITAELPEGAALNFDGVNDYASRPGVITTQTNNITMQARVLLSAATATNQVILHLGNTSTSGYGFYAASNREIKILYSSNTVIATGYVLPLNQWTPLALVIESGGTVRFYANGLQVFSGTPASPPSTPSGSFLIGGNNTGSENLNGTVDEVLFWTRALTQCEILTNINNEIATTASSLTANYHFNQGVAAGINTTVTTVTDASGNGNTLTLNNFSQTGATSNWVEPGGVVSGYTVTSPVSSTIAVTGNGNAIPNGSTGTSITNNTNFNGVAQQTFAVANTGGNLYVNNITLSGLNASDFSVTSAQSFSLGNGNSIVLSVAYSPFIVGTSTAIVTIKSSNCAVPDYSFVITSSVTAGAALSFDGTNDYASRPVITTQTTNITLQAKIYLRNTMASGPIIFTNGSTGADGYGMLVASNSTELVLLYGGKLIANTGHFITLNQWTDVSLVIQNNRPIVYVNGIQVYTTSYTIAPNVPTGNFVVGANQVGAQLFPGNIDEVKIWNRALSQCEIQQYLNCEIPTTGTSLIGNYHFNQGLASVANPTVNSVIDASGSSNHLTMSNFALTGSTSNWITPGGVLTLSTTPATVTSSITLSANSTSILAATAPSTLNFTDFNGVTTRTFVITNAGTGTLNLGTPYITGVNDSEFSVTVNPAGSLTAGGTTSFVVAFTATAGGVRSASVNINSNDCGKPLFIFAIQATAPLASALDFDGTNDHIVIPYNSALSLNSGSFTIEFWAKPTIVDGNFRWVVSKDNGNANLDYEVGITASNVWRFCARNLSIDLYGNTVATVGTLYHVAAVFDGATAKLYVNGILENATNNVGTAVINTSNILIGSRTATSPAQYFAGTIDDLRLWNVARTQCDINAYKECEIPTTLPGLVANYHFNQGSAAIANPGVITLTDAAGTYTGTLTNFLLSGTTSNWVSPGGVTTGSAAPAVVSSPTLVISGNGNNITNGSVLTNTANFTDFGSASTRTFVIQNTSTVTANIFFGQFTGANASSYSLAALPSTVIAAGGSSSFVVAFTPTAIGTHSAVLIVKTSDCATPNYSFVITASVAAASALSFDGSNDYVEAPNSAALMMSNALSVEAWVKQNNTSSIQYIVSKGPGDLINGQYGIVLIDGTPQFHMYNSGHAGITANYTLTAGVWTHLAATWDGVTARIYVNGVLYGSTPVAFTLPANTGALQIGSVYANNYVFNGAIDELRIWNTARTQCEILSYMNAETTSTLTGLVANYHFNQGIPSGANLSVTTLTDSSVNNNTGTLYTFNLTAGNSTSNWINPGGVISGSVTPAVISASIGVSANSNTITQSTTTSTLNFTDFGSVSVRTYSLQNAGTGTLYINSVVLSGANAADFNLTTVPASSLTTAGSTFAISFTPAAVGTRSAVVTINSSDCTHPTYSFVITGSVSAASALNFDGLNDFIVTPTVAAFNMTNTATIEGWFKTTSPVAHQEVFMLYNSVGNKGFEAQISNGMFQFNTYLGNWINYPTGITVNDGNWHHYAVVVNGSTATAYLDGIYVASVTGTASINIGNAELYIGKHPLVGAYFNGSIDETRVWNTARTQCEIQSYMNCEIPTLASGLVANYHFNQGIPSGSNLSVTTLTDAASGINGTLNTYALTGSASNWISPGAVISGSVTPAVINGSIGVSANSNTITQGTSTSTLNFTDFGAATVRTYSLQNAGTGTLYINSVTLSGANASDFTVTALPASALTTAGSTFAITFTPTAIGTRTALVTINSSDCDSPNYSFAITGSVSAASALSFDGTNDYILTPNLSVQLPINAAGVTIEAWFKANAAGVIIGEQGSTTLGFGWHDSQIEVLPTGSVMVSTYPINAVCVGTVNFGTWNHVVMRYNDATHRVDGFLNGQASTTFSTVTRLSPLTNSYPQYFAIGAADATNLGNGSYFNGSVDEVRIWNVPRTDCDIQSYMNCEIPATAPGLIANYHFNQGVPSGSNTSITNLTDAAGSGDATLNFFALTGNTSNWVSPGGVINGSATPVSITSSISLSGAAATITNNATGTSTTNLTDYDGASSRVFVITNTGTGTLNISTPFLSGVNAAEFSVSVLPATSLAAGGTTSFTIVFTPTAGGIRTATVNIISNDCNKPLFNFTIKGSPPVAEALAFDGTGSYVDLGAGANLKPTAALTAEAWVFSSTWPSADKTIIGNTESSGYGIFTRTTGQLEGLVRRNSAFAMVTTPLAGLTAGWHHVALTYNGQITALYVDGALKSIDNAGATYPIDYIGNNTLIGAEASSGSAPIPGWYFNGKIDEVRVWNTARTQCEIQSYMGAEIPAGATNLVVNYHFNQGSAGLNNASVTTLIDAAGATTGTLAGFALTGTLSNWVAPGGVAPGYTAIATPSAEINILGNNVTINDNTTTTSLSDNTNFGGACINNSVTKTFTVQNTGTTILTVATVTVTGADAGAFAINGSSATIAAGGNATFAVTFTGSAVGVKNATINIISSDCDESLYDFAITGTVNPAPFISTSNGLICQGQSYTLSATGADTYTYSSGQVVSPFSTTNYSITGTSTAGCVSSNTAVAQVFVNAIPPVGIAGTNTICNSGSTTFTASNAFTYTWSNGVTGPVVSLSPTVTTTYTVTGAYANGCANTAVRVLSVSPTPTVTVNNGTICPGQSFTITPSGASTYSYANDGPVVNPTVTTSYSVTGTSSVGCNSSAASISTVSVMPTPTINIANYTICNGSSVTLNPTGGVSYTFEGGSASVSPTTTTSYTIAGENASGCVSTITATVTVDASPVLTITASSATICTGAATTLTATGASSYSWSNGSLTQNISVSPTANTTYTVTGTDINSCVGTATQNIVVNSLPTITIANAAICPGNSYTLLPSGASTYSFSSGTDVVSPAITSTYAVTGTSSLGCVASSSAIATVSVINTVTVAVTGNTTICEGATTTLTAGGAISYSWSNGMVTSTVALSPTVNTTYTVYGVSGTCSNNAVVSVSVNAAPTITVNSGMICAGDSFTMTPGGATTYTYSSGSDIVSPVTTTVYSVAGTDAIGCVSTTSAISTITVNASPTLTIAATNNTICTGETITLTATGATTYLWDTGLTTQTISVSPAANTAYTVTGTDANSCTGSTVQNIVVNPLPTITIPNGAICPGNSYTLVPSGAATYSFSSGTDVVTPPALGTYTYAVLGTSSLGCVASSSAIATVSVVNTISIAVTGNTTICEGVTTTLTASGATTYSWSNGALTSSVALSPTVNTTYTVYGVSGTCSNTAVVSVSVNAAPAITVNSGVICAGDSFTMIPGGASSYTYSGGSDIVSPVTTTVYSVAGTNAIGCISTTSAISTITVNALPTLTISVPSASICTGLSTTLAASGANTYTWSNTLQTTTISVSPTANTTYTVSGTGANGCIGSTSQLIAINPLPTITIPNGAVCPGNSYTLVPSGADTYSFSSGTDIINPAVTATYAVIGTSSLGCVASSSAIATVSVINTVTVAVTGNTTICEGVTTTLTASGATTYSWSNGITTDTVTLSPTSNTSYTVYGASGTCSNSAVVTITVNSAPGVNVNSGVICSGQSFTMNPSGTVSYSYSGGSDIVSPTTTTSYSVTGIDALGCASTTMAISTVTVNALPTPTITATGYTLCSGVTTTLTVSGITTYTWSDNSNANNIAVAPASNTTYSVSGTGTNGCVGSTLQAIAVNPLPTITVPGGVICPGNSFTLAPSGAATYSFSSGTDVVTPPAIGTYTYGISGTSSLGCVASTSAIATVSVINSLTIPVTGNTVICVGQTATLTAGGATTYSWSNGVTTDTVTLSPTANTTYTVYGVSGTCSNNAVVQVSVNAVPTITVNSGAICSGSSFTLNPGGAVTYTYSNGSAIVNPIANASYSVAGTNAAGCVSTASAIANVTVNASPTVAIASPTAVCDGSPVTLTVSGATSYSWNTTSTAAVITPTPAPGSNNYSVTGTDANGCSSTASQSIHIDPLPTITVNGGAVCPGGSFTLNPQGAATYSFSSGSDVVSPPVIGTYTYGISGASAAGCVASGSAIATVSVVSTLTLTVSGNTTICTGEQSSLTVGGASSYSWSTGITTDTITLSPNATTDYTVYGMSGSCMDKALVTVSVNALPTVSVSGGTICSGSGFTFVPSGALTYSYSGGSAVVNPTINTSYSVTGVDANGCVSSNTAIAEVTVMALPTVTVAITNPSVCAGNTTSLSAGGATAYVWSDAQTAPTIAITPGATTVYTVTGTDANGCQNSASVTAFVSPGASLTVSGSSLVCAGTTASLSVSGASTYTWNTGETTSTLGVTPGVTTSYSVTGSLPGSCDASVVSTISVSPMPTLTVSGADSVCVNSTVVLGASGANTYSWSTGETSPSITFIPSLSGSYSVTGTNSVGCSATSTVDVVIKSCVKKPIELVNAVTPNSDGLNDTWIIRNIQEYPKNKVVVFNRWGIEVYSVTGYNNDDKVWPAKGETTNLTASTYFYIIDLKDGSKPIKGWVELIID